MGQALSRRQFGRLMAAAGGGLVVGFDPGARAWVTHAHGAARPFQGLPRLDGALVVDETARAEMARDGSNAPGRIPAAVLRPGSVQDVVSIVRYANQHSIKVAIRGNGHSQYGQTQAEDGIAIDTRTLNTVQVLGKESVDAQPGAFWGAVAGTTLAQGLTPLVFPTCATITVGGTLSVGLISSTSHRHGAQVDNVTELDVVTGDGRLVTCSPERESDLFAMTLGGLGQCGVIVRARVRVARAPSHVVLRTLLYDDLERYLAGQRRLAAEGRVDHLAGAALRKPDGDWTFSMEVGTFASSPIEPSAVPIDAGLQFDSAPSPVRMTYQDYLFRFEAQNAGFASSKAQRAYLAMLIPASTARDSVMNVLALPRDATGLPRIGGAERFAFHPLQTGRFTRPLLRVPAEEQAFMMWLFRSAPAGDTRRLAALRETNRDLLTKLTAAGGKRYVPYGEVASRDEWAQHFGPETWRRLVAAKTKYDPNGVLSPGPAIF